MIVYVWPAKNSSHNTIVLVSCILSAGIITDLNNKIMKINVYLFNLKKKKKN